MSTTPLSLKLQVLLSLIEYTDFLNAPIPVVGPVAYREGTQEIPTDASSTDWSS